MNVYLDVCCLNRLFDDISQPRVALEAAAVISVLQLIDSGKLTDHSSEMAQIEIQRMNDSDRSRKVTSLLPPKERIIPLSNELLDLSQSIISMGFDLADAVHLGTAQLIGIDAFLSVDDKLLKRAKKHALGFRVLNPVDFLEEFGDAIDR